ncbi:MAG: NAD(+) synthase [Clostridiales bacterium]|nr:NAD(+) synthase [Clostridiales bacterium]
MKFGFVKTGAFTPKIKVADVGFNTVSIIDGVRLAGKSGVEVLSFPELCITGYTCGDLFYNTVLIDNAKLSLKEIAEKTRNVTVLFFVGLPYKANGFLYDVVAGVCQGEVLGFVPKKYPSDGFSANELRYFAPAPKEVLMVDFFGKRLPFGTNLLFNHKTETDLSVGVCVGSDAFAPRSPIISYAEAGASIIVNPLFCAETVGGLEYRKATLSAISSTTLTAIVCSTAGGGESTTDSVSGGDRLIFENGHMLTCGKLFTTGLTFSEVDTTYLSYQRAKSITTFDSNVTPYATAEFDIPLDGEELTRTFDKTPFTPSTDTELDRRAELILDIQSEGLKKRLAHTCSKTAVLGLSGGLDSTLAIIVATLAMKKLNRPSKDVVAVTMPCFGTTSRTYLNTIKLAKALGVTLKKVDITKSVTRHLKDIGHDLETLDVTFENAQARERTQVIMDIANMQGGMVIGTGDLSELALGWATYNGDHMSMYGVNASIPKTLVRHVVSYYANKSRGKLKAVLLDILDTPVSPELLPAENGEISQKTEDIVGPYILHDFFLYNFISKGYSPQKLYHVAKHTFKTDFKAETILKWLKTFYRRFFTQQFKRSCVPDGVKVGTVSLSPRTDFKMPSDAVATAWLTQLEDL